MTNNSLDILNNYIKKNNSIIRAKILFFWRFNWSHKNEKWKNKIKKQGKYTIFNWILTWPHIYRIKQNLKWRNKRYDERNNKWQTKFSCRLFTVWYSVQLKRTKNLCSHGAVFHDWCVLLNWPYTWCVVVNLLTV